MAASPVFYSPGLFTQCWLSARRDMWNPVFRDAAAIGVRAYASLKRYFLSLKNAHFLDFRLYKNLQSRCGRMVTVRLSYWRAQTVCSLLRVLRYNPIVTFLINAVFPLDVLVAYRLGALKQELAQVLPGWLVLWQELERRLWRQPGQMSAICIQMLPLPRLT